MESSHDRVDESTRRNSLPCTFSCVRRPLCTFRMAGAEALAMPVGFGGTS